MKKVSLFVGAYGVGDLRNFRKGGEVEGTVLGLHEIPSNSGWASTLVWDRGEGFGLVRKTVNGVEENASENRAFLKAIVEGLAMLVKPCHVILYGSDPFTLSTIRDGWPNRWTQATWEKKEDTDLWREIQNFMEIHSIEPISVDWENKPGFLALTEKAAKSSRKLKDLV